MGVHNLWALLLPISRRVSIETLTNKVLAVDASIWLVQFVKAMRDSEGNMNRNAHLLGTLRRYVRYVVVFSPLVSNKTHTHTHTLALSLS